LSAMTRAQAARLVEQHGGRAADAVTRTTDLLVAGAAPGAKLDRARRLGIPVIPEQEFLRRYAVTREETSP